MNRNPIFPAAWPLRHFKVNELLALVSEFRPRVLELSKDFLGGDVSLKGLARSLEGVRASNSIELVLAGTTDLVRCAGFPWERYRRYLAVQIAQARFLDCRGFRLMVGQCSSAVESAHGDRPCWGALPGSVAGAGVRRDSWRGRERAIGTRGTAAKHPSHDRRRP